MLQEQAVSLLVSFFQNGEICMRLPARKTDGGWLRKYGSLESMEEELEGCYFLRTRKNYIVNQKYVREVGNRDIYMLDGSTLEMGRDRKNAVREAMRQYDRERCRM